MGIPSLRSAAADFLSQGWESTNPNRLKQIEKRTRQSDDALGRVVEQQSGATYTEILYSPVGKTALMNGQTLKKAFINLPGGGTAIYNSTGLAYYRHSDWLGSSRMTSTAGRTAYSTSAYAPYGEQYAVSGAADPSFTGQNSDTVPSLYDFESRENSSSQGRWISPDPARLAAVNPNNPQTWNLYSYVVNNPLALVDPKGLWCVWETTKKERQANIAQMNRNGLAVLGTPGWDLGPAVDGTNVPGPVNDHDPDPGNGGADQQTCVKEGGHWDPTDTITGIIVDKDGNVLEIDYVGGGTCKTADCGAGGKWTLEQFDQMLIKFAPNNYTKAQNLSVLDPNYDVKKIIYTRCKDSAGDRVRTSMRNGAISGTATGAVFGFVSGEVTTGEISFGASGPVGAYIGAHLGGVMGTIRGLEFGLVFAGACALAGAY